MDIFPASRRRVNSADCPRRRLPSWLTSFRENRFPVWLRQRIRERYPDVSRSVPNVCLPDWLLRRCGRSWLDHHGQAIYRGQVVFISRPRDMGLSGLQDLLAFAHCLDLNVQFEPTGVGENLHVIIIISPRESRGGRNAG